MLKQLIIITLSLANLTLKAQDPFEKYPAIEYQGFKNWKVYDKGDTAAKLHHTLTIPKFFDNQDSLTIQLTSFRNKGYWTTDSSVIRIYRNSKQIQKIFEPMFFYETNIGDESVRVADINGDKLKDIKLVAWYMGNGTASMNVRVIYLFQEKDGLFKKVSFLDKNIRPERDFDNDGNYEIITMTLKGYENHSYWVCNLFNYKEGALINVNEKDDYPIMIQFLYRENHEITNKLTRAQMKKFALTLPEEYDAQ